MLRFVFFVLFLVLGWFVGTLTFAIENDQLDRPWLIALTVFAAMLLTTLSNALEMVKVKI